MEHRRATHRASLSVLPWRCSQQRGGDGSLGLSHQPCSGCWELRTPGLVERPQQRGRELPRPHLAPRAPAPILPALHPCLSVISAGACSVVTSTANLPRRCSSIRQSRPLPLLKLSPLVLCDNTGPASLTSLTVKPSPGRAPSSQPLAPSTDSLFCWSHTHAGFSSPAPPVTPGAFFGCLLEHRTDITNLILKKSESRFSPRRLVCLILSRFSRCHYHPWSRCCQTPR